MTLLLLLSTALLVPLANAQDGGAPAAVEGEVEGLPVPEEEAVPRPLPPEDERVPMPPPPDGEGEGLGAVGAERTPDLPEDAGQQPEKARRLPENSSRGDGLVLVLGDENSVLTGQRIHAVLTADDDPISFELLDDGEGADAVAGDGVYAGLLEDFPRGSVQMALVGSEREPVWSSIVDIGPQVKRPRVKVALLEDGALFFLDTFAGGPMGIDGAPPPRVDAGGPPGGMNADPDAPLVGPPAGATSPRQWSEPGGALLVGLGLGGGLAWWLTGRRQRPLRRFQPLRQRTAPADPPNLPPLAGRKQVWTVPDGDQVQDATAALAARLVDVATVLLVPAPGHRKALAAALGDRAGLLWPSRDQPVASELVASARALSAFGPVVVLVEGLLALEEPLEKEGQDAVVVELLDEAGDDVTVLVVAASGQVGDVAVALGPVEGGLGTEEHGVLIPA